MKLIEVKNLSFSYDGKHEVINDVSFDIFSSSYVTIIGKNGSGKSTIAKLLMGLLKANDNALFAFNLPYDKKNILTIRSRIGIVFQNPDNQFIGATVADDIAFGLENRCIAREEMPSIIEKYTNKVGMEKYLNKEPENLSGGQKQRVAIAGVLALKPDVIIFDEATAMLDPKGKREIKETIKSLKEENPNIAIISITHDVEEAFSSDRIIVLDEGKVVYDCSPDELLKHKEELYKLGLDIPFKEKLFDALKENNLDKVIGDLND